MDAYCHACGRYDRLDPATAMCAGCLQRWRDAAISRAVRARDTRTLRLRLQPPVA